MKAQWQYRYGDREILISSVVIIAVLVIGFASISFIGSSKSKSDSIETESELLNRPLNEETWTLRGDVARFTGRHGRAILCYDQAIKYDSSYAKAWFGRGLALSALSRDNEALTSVDKASVLEPWNNEFEYYRNLFLTDLRKGARSYIGDTLVVHIPSADYEAWVRLGLHFLDKVRLKQAMAAFDSALHTRHDLEVALVGKARCLSKLGREKEAGSLFQYVISLDSTSFWSRYFYASHLMSNNQFDAALQEYKQARSIRPTYVPASMGYAHASSRLGKHADAIEALTKAVEYERDAPDIFELIAYEYSLEGLPDSSLPYIQKADSLSPGDTVIAFTVVSTLTECKRYDEALERLSQFDTASQLTVTFLIAKSYCLDQQGKHLDSYKLIVQALQAAPNNALVINNLADALMKLGRLQEALDTISRAYQLPNTDSATMSYVNITHQEILDSIAAHQ